MGRKIIFDTDIGGNCDDAAALALELMNAGECELLAVTHCTMHESAARCIESILNYYGHPEIPVAQVLRSHDAAKGRGMEEYYGKINSIAESDQTSGGRKNFR